MILGGEDFYCLAYNPNLVLNSWQKLTPTLLQGIQRNHSGSDQILLIHLELISTHRSSKIHSLTRLLGAHIMDFPRRVKMNSSQIRNNGGTHIPEAVAPQRRSFIAAAGVSVGVGLLEDYLGAQ